MSKPTVPEALRQLAAAAVVLADALTAGRIEIPGQEVACSHEDQSRPVPEPRRAPPVLELPEREGLTKTEVKILTALAQAGRSLSGVQIGTRAGISHRTGPFSKTLAELRREQFIVGSIKAIEITQEGREALGSFAALPEGHVLFDYWCSKVGGTGAKVLRALRKCYRDGAITWSAEQVGSEAGISHKTGPFSKALATLRRLELIVGSGSELALSPEMKRACEITIGVHDTSTGKSVRVDRGGRVSK